MSFPTYEEVLALLLKPETLQRRWDEIRTESMPTTYPPSFAAFVKEESKEMYEASLILLMKRVMAGGKIESPRASPSSRTNE